MIIHLDVTVKFNQQMEAVWCPLKWGSWQKGEIPLIDSNKNVRQMLLKGGMHPGIVG